MPAHKHNRHNRAREDEHNNNNNVCAEDHHHHHHHHQPQQQQQPHNGGGGVDHHHHQQQPQQQPQQQQQQQPQQPPNDNQNGGGGGLLLARCCVPSGCVDPDELIDPSDPVQATKVVCNNEHCTMGQWMHRQCFEVWEQSVLSYLRSCGRARSWSEKQRLQNLWTKKGYDLAFKACDCKCSRGHLRKDLDYVAPLHNDNARKSKKHRRKNDRPVAVMTSKTGMNTNGNHGNQNGHSHLRLRTNSGSTGTSPPSSYLSSSPGTPVSPSTPVNGNIFLKKSKFDFVPPDPAQGLNGSIFRRRSDFSAFNNLRRYKQNPYYIKMEDEGPHGNDDTRVVVLSTLSSHKMASLQCVLCRNELPVFDRYPLVDGTLFLSPQAYGEQLVHLVFDDRPQYLNAVCISCLEGRTDIRCFACKRRWDGSTLLLGTMYTYDIFAAMPCCPRRLTCKNCRRAVVDVSTGLAYYSEYSHKIECPYCKLKDYHFIRPLSETFLIKQPIWN